MKLKDFPFLVILVALFLAIFAPALAESDVKEVILATTTSVYDTGLLDLLGEKFREETGYIIQPVAVGTGEALAMASRGEVDIVIVHNEKAEMDFMEKGYGISRERIMHNFFVIAGPRDDPAGIKDAADVFEAFRKIEKGKYCFISRGDDSGTNKKELEIWEKLSIKPCGDRYIESGQGMAETLNIASEKQAYTLTDVSTFTFLEENLDLAVLMDDSSDLINIYSAILVNPEKFPSVNSRGGELFIQFLISKEAQQMIEDFGREEFGRALFTPDRLQSDDK